MPLKDFRFETLPRSTQLLVIGVLLVGLSGAVYMLYLKDLIERRSSLENDVARLEKTVAQETAILTRLSQFKREVAELDRRLEVLRAILPSEKETPILLARVQDLAASSNLKIMKFVPQAIVPRAFYVDWPIQVSVEGSYDALGRFFSKISQSTRIINVETIAVRGLDGSTDPARTLSATCIATTFVFREDQAAPAAH